MNFKCLILDHDDTVVNSTATVHYPAHLEIMNRMRPEEKHISLDEWFRKNFHPGIMDFLTGELGFSEEEMAEEFRIWQEFNADRNPPFFEGLPELLREFQDKGGILAVVSHSTENHIRRHYDVGAPMLNLSYVYGWEHENEHRKPSPWPVLQILEKAGLEASEVLVVDDLKPGVDMARAAGVKVAAAGWGHAIPEIRQAMASACDWWLADVEALRTLVFD